MQQSGRSRVDLFGIGCKLVSCMNGNESKNSGVTRATVAKSRLPAKHTRACSRRVAPLGKQTMKKTLILIAILAGCLFASGCTYGGGGFGHGGFGQDKR